MWLRRYVKSIAYGGHRLCLVLTSLHRFKGNGAEIKSIIEKSHKIE